MHLHTIFDTKMVKNVEYPHESSIIILQNISDMYVDGLGPPACTKIDSLYTYYLHVTPVSSNVRKTSNFDVKTSLTGSALIIQLYTNKHSEKFVHMTN